MTRPIPSGNAAPFRTRFDVPYENLTTYTEVDTPARLAVSALIATLTDLDMDESVSLYKDFGAGYFDALDIDFQVKFVGSSHGTLTAVGFLVGLFTATRTGIAGLGSTEIAVSVNVSTGPVYRLLLYRGNSVAIDTSVNLSTDTVYYCTLARAAGNDTVTLSIYSDQGRNTLVDTLSVSGYSTSTYRYFYAVMGANQGVSARALDYVVQKINLAGTGEFGSGFLPFF